MASSPSNVALKAAFDGKIRLLKSKRRRGLSLSLSVDGAL
jgi:hypothetical protein